MTPAPRRALARAPAVAPSEPEQGEQQAVTSVVTVVSAEVVQAAIQDVAAATLVEASLLNPAAAPHAGRTNRARDDSYSRSFLPYACISSGPCSCCQHDTWLQTKGLSHCAACLRAGIRAVLRWFGSNVTGTLLTNNAVMLVNTAPYYVAGSGMRFISFRLLASVVRAVFYLPGPGAAARFSLF